MSRVLAALARKSNRSVLAAVATAGTALANPASAMDAASALERFKGHTIAGEYASGETFTEMFGNDGATVYIDGTGTFEGRASVSARQLCFDYPDEASLEGGCFEIERNGGNCFTFYTASDRVEGTGWTARAWRVDQPSTCVDVLTS